MGGAKAADGAVEQGEIRWDWPLYEQIGAAMKAAPGRIIPSIQSWSIASTLGMARGGISAGTIGRP